MAVIASDANALAASALCQWSVHRLPARARGSAASAFSASRLDARALAASVFAASVLAASSLAAAAIASAVGPSVDRVLAASALAATTLAGSALAASVLAVSALADSGVDFQTCKRKRHLKRCMDVSLLQAAIALATSGLDVIACQWKRHLKRCTNAKERTLDTSALAESADTAGPSTARVLADAASAVSTLPASASAKRHLKRLSSSVY